MSERTWRLLDLFCGAGGSAMGYHRAGFTVTGVDHLPQPHYPFAFVQADALEYVAQHGREYDAIHASPPCQHYSALKHLVRREHGMLVEATHSALRATARPYVIENVVGAPLDTILMLCGSMFGLETPCGAQLRRHRLFESNLLLLSPGECLHGLSTIGIVGHALRYETLRMARRRTISVKGRNFEGGNGTSSHEYFSVQDARCAMGINWMNSNELSQAIPPAYTAWIGKQLRTALLQRGTPYA